MAQAPEPGGDVQSDVILPPPAGEPGPGTVGQLHFGKLLQGPVGFEVEPVVVEENPDIPARLAFGLRLAQPGGFLDQHALEVLIFLERAVERRRAAPLREDAVNLRIGVGDVARQGIGVEPVESLLRAFVRILHQVRQRQHGVPGGIRHHLDGEALLAQRGGLAGLEKPGELEPLRRRTANRQGQGFGEENLPRQHRQKSFLAVRHAAGRADGLVAEKPRAIRHFDAPGVTARFLGGNIEGDLGRGVAEQAVGGPVVHGFVESQPDFAFLARRGLVGDFHGELEGVAFAQEAGRIGLHHQVFGRDRLVGEKTGAAVGIVPPRVIR